MGIWDFIYSTAETVKNNAPNLDPVKDACKSSYGYGSAAFWKIDNAVRVNGIQKVKHSMPDEQGRARITLYASKFVQNAAYYGFKEAYNLVPGGKAISKIVSQTVKDVESENRKVVKEGTDASGKSSFDYHQKGISADSAANQTPEDMLRIFMMKHFIGTHFLDNLIIPQKGHGKESK